MSTPPLVAISVVSWNTAALTLLLGCWSRGDIEHLQHLHQRFAAGRPRLGARFLAWAYQRAPGEGTS